MDTLEQIRALLGANTPTGPTFSEVWAKYWRAEGKKHDTARDIERRGRLLCAFIGDKPALAFTVEEAENYRDTRKDSVRVRQLYKRAGVPYRRKPRPATLNREIETARRVLQWAIEQRPQLIAYNPLAAVKAEKEKNTRRAKIRTEAELQKLLAVSDEYLRAYILIAVDSGPRREEILSLEWKQIMLVGPEQSPVIELWDTKNEEPRRIGLSQRAYEAIRALPRVDRYIFVGREAGTYRIRPDAYLGGDAFLKRFQRACVEARILDSAGKPLRLHDLRHTYAYFSRVVHGLSERAIMAQGGWKTRSAFDRYGVGDEQERVRMMEQVNASIKQQLAGLKK